ncbi:MAG: VWA domain-containing protein [Actinomycetes bacterium]|nr:VWA domain-containing protein [Actinomycetes bacterium]
MADDVSQHSTVTTGKDSPEESKAGASKQTWLYAAIGLLLALVIIGVLIASGGGGGGGGGGSTETSGTASVESSETTASRQVVYDETLSFYRSAPENIKTDPDTGIQYIDNELLITVKEGTTREEVEKLAAQYDGEIVGYQEALEQYRVLFAAHYNLDELGQIIEMIATNSAIDYAEENLVLNSAISESESTSRLYSAAKSSVGVSNPVDLVFVIDTTGSMGDEINNVKSNLASFMRYLGDRGISLRVGFIEYRDITADGEDSTKPLFNGDTFWHSSAEEGIETLDSIVVDGGGDDPETVLDALGILQSEPDSEGIPWNVRASKFAIVLTDAGYKTENNFEISDMDEMVDALTLHANQKITTSVVTTTELYDTYRPLADGTGGILADINASDFWESLLSFADSIIEMVDTDLDGLPDEWELNGIAGLSLKEMGADINVKDVFLEVDYMVDGLGRSLAPTQRQLRMVYEAFKKHGINLHIDAGSDSIDFVTGKKWGGLSESNTVAYFEGEPSDVEWGELVKNNLSESRQRVFRHALMLDNSSGKTMGLANGNVSQYFWVSTAHFIYDKDISSSVRDRAISATFMHELGHTLGLGHGGRSIDDNPDHTLYKPNYLSIMNYLFLSGIPYSSKLGESTGFLLDYSSYEMPPLVEKKLSETEGIDLDNVTESRGFITQISKNRKWPGYDEKTKTYNGKPIWILPGHGVDYNGDGDTEDVIKMDLGREWTSGGYTAYGKVFSVLESHNDWNNLVFVGGSVGASAEILSTPEIDTASMPEEPTYKEMKQLIQNEEKIISEATGREIAPEAETSMVATVVVTGGGMADDSTGLLLLVAAIGICAVIGIYAATKRSGRTHFKNDTAEEVKEGL